MHESIYIAASAGLKQSKKMDVIAQNLANVNNSGYKRDALVFKEMMPPFPPDERNEEAKNILLTPEKSNKNVSYVGITDYYTDFSVGVLKKTGGPLDLAMDGEGFFKILKLKSNYEKPSEKKKRERSENIKRSKKIQRMRNNF